MTKPFVWTIVCPPVNQTMLMAVGTAPDGQRGIVVAHTAEALGAQQAAVETSWRAQQP